MKQAFMKARNIAHRRFGYSGTNWYLEIKWHEIGAWQGQTPKTCTQISNLKIGKILSVADGSERCSK